MTHLDPPSTRLLLAASLLANLGLPLRAQDELHALSGVTSGDSFGRAVDAAGDVNADGYDDIVVGAPFDSPHGVFEAGSVTVYSGADGSVLHSWTGDAANHQFGFAVAGLGDWNGDGFDDVAASTYHLPVFGPSYVRVFSGKDGTVMLAPTGAAEGWFGAALGRVGDVDGDGLDDLLVGSPYAGLVGEVQVLGTTLSGFPVLILQGDDPNDAFGWSVSGGDVTGDGVPDIAVGAPQFALDTGYARVFDGATGLPRYTRIGPAFDDQMGYAVDMERDVDGDGLADLVVGIPKHDTGGQIDVGRVYVYQGLFGIPIGIHDGLDTGDWFGASVSTADVNADGFADVIVGAPRDDAGGPLAGSVAVFSGETQSLIAKVLGKGDYGALGWSVAGAGRVGSPKPGANDGLEDFVAGGPDLATVPGPGKARVYSGARFLLDVFPPEVAPTDVFTITLAEGELPDFNLLFLTGVNGNPVAFDLFGFQLFAPVTGVTQHAIPAPPSLAGKSLSFTGLGVLDGQIVLSNTETVSIQ